jgi:hypothetical protein
MIAIHAISQPSLQKKNLALFKDDPKLYPSAQAAMLEDRILVFSGKKQIYGTQMDWDENGLMNPFPIEDPETIDERRDVVGLEPLKDNIKRLRTRASAEREHPPEDFVKRKREREDWMRRTGWITD